MLVGAAAAERMLVNGLSGRAADEELQRISVDRPLCGADRGLRGSESVARAGHASRILKLRQWS